MLKHRERVPGQLFVGRDFPASAGGSSAKAAPNGGAYIAVLENGTLKRLDGEAFHFLGQRAERPAAGYSSDHFTEIVVASDVDEARTTLAKAVEARVSLQYPNLVLSPNFNCTKMSMGTRLIRKDFSGIDDRYYTLVAHESPYEPGKARTVYEVWVSKTPFDLGKLPSETTTGQRVDPEEIRNDIAENH